jgi:hypothetical protein
MDLDVAGEEPGDVMVAGPDTVANPTGPTAEPLMGLRFRPGALPRLLGVPAHELLDGRVRLDELVPTMSGGRSLVGLAADLADAGRGGETAPWSMPQLSQITGGLAAGASIGAHGCGRGRHRPGRSAVRLRI